MKRILGVVIVALALLAPSAAFASGGSTCQAYNPQLCSSVSNATASKSASKAAASTLPFTGLDVVLLVAGAGVLMTGGLVLRRLSRDEDQN